MVSEKANKNERTHQIEFSPSQNASDGNDKNSPQVHDAHVLTNPNLSSNAPPSLLELPPSRRPAELKKMTLAHATVLRT